MGLPKRLERLEELANNLWWSWHPQARELFRTLDYELWRAGSHNPVKQLREMSSVKLKAAANDAVFLTLYDAVMAAFDADMAGRHSWFSTKHPDQLSEPIAYFSAEFAIHNSLPIYAGGLGVMSGDTCKEACDLGLPLAAIGFMYPQGYFRQRISAEGWQEELYRELNFEEAPITPCAGNAPTCGPLTQLQLDDRTVYIGAWQVRIGRVNLYLLDTNIAGNTPQDQRLSARLYIADREQRIQQEIVLGIGGVRVLRALGINPVVWHANEGHTAFMMLERIREEVEGGLSFDNAVRKIAERTVFTTHTPVPAGHDIFPAEFVEKYLNRYWESLGINRETLLKLGQHEGAQERTFNMTTLALRLATQRNGVSELHSVTSRKMWHILWPELSEEQVPISQVTNGVHVPTWISRELRCCFDAHLGKDWVQKQDDPELWKHIDDIPAKELWDIHKALKRKLFHIILERAQKHWAEGRANAQQVIAMGSLLDQDTLTIGFVRRFAEYKRPSLVFQDIERLKRIVNDRWRPIQIIFAGKSHPADFPSKFLLQKVYNLAIDRAFQGRIAFVEDYDMHLARYLVQGVDVWLNTPRRLQEACGTSGMKAALNGVLHLSVQDGWWYEGYNGKNGWAIDGLGEIANPAEEDKNDAEAIYRLLEKEVVPLYYDRDRSDTPQRWVSKMKESINSIAPVFCAQRMLKEYVEGMYLPSTETLKHR